VAEGKDHHYKPDFLIRARNKKGDTIMLILEITGANKQYKAEKKHFTETYWLPAVNSVKDVVAELGGVEWRFLEVSGEIREVKTQIVNVVNL
jgi:type III restriction enzyme